MERMKVHALAPGTEGQVVTTDANGRAVWGFVPGSEPELPEGGAEGDVLTIGPGGVLAWVAPEDVGDQLPPVGPDGQVLTVVGGVAAWADPPAGSGGDPTFEALQVIHHLSDDFVPQTDATRHFTWAGDFPNAEPGDVLVVFTTETDAAPDWTGPAPWNGAFGGTVINSLLMGTENFTTPGSGSIVGWRLHAWDIDADLLAGGGFYLNQQPGASADSRITWTAYILRNLTSFPADVFPDRLNYLNEDDAYNYPGVPVSWPAANATSLNPILTVGVAVSDGVETWDGPDGGLWAESPRAVGPSIRHYAHTSFSTGARAADSDPTTAMGWATWQFELGAAYSDLPVATVLDDLTDVDTTTTPPADGDGLVYDTADNRWKPGTVVAGVDLEQVRDAVAALLVAGSNVTLTVDDPGDTITIAATDTNTTDPEVVRDTIGAALVAGANVTLTVDDTANTITIAATGGGGSTGDYVATFEGALD